MKGRRSLSDNRAKVFPVPEDRPGVRVLVQDQIRCDGHTVTLSGKLKQQIMGHGVKRDAASLAFANRSERAHELRSPQRKLLVLVPPAELIRHGCPSSQQYPTPTD
jgi:hypothetical protein